MDSLSLTGNFLYLNYCHYLLQVESSLVIMNKVWLLQGRGRKKPQRLIFEPTLTYLYQKAFQQHIVLLSWQRWHGPAIFQTHSVMGLTRITCKFLDGGKRKYMHSFLLPTLMHMEFSALKCNVLSPQNSTRICEFLLVFMEVSQIYHILSHACGLLGDESTSCFSCHFIWTVSFHCDGVNVHW